MQEQESANEFLKNSDDGIAKKDAVSSVAMARKWFKSRHCDAVIVVPTFPGLGGLLSNAAEITAAGENSWDGNRR